MKAASHHAPFDRYSVAYPEIGITYLAEVEWPVMRVPRVHSHRELQVLWILEGAMGLDMDGQRLDPGEGTCYIIPAQRLHLVFQRPATPRVLFLDLRLIAEPAGTMVQFLTGLKHVQLQADARKLRSATAGLRDALAQSSNARMAQLQMVLWKMISELNADNPARREDADLDAGSLKVRIADNLMRDKLAQPLDIEDVAAAAGISRSQLTRLYVKHFSAGPAERLRQLRIEKACELMSSSTLNVKEVAHVCGFVCPNHFCRVFLRTIGSTPSEYRWSRFAAGRREATA